MSFLCLISCKTEQGEETDEYTALHEKGVTSYLAGSYDSAIMYWEQVHTLAEENNDMEWSAMTLNNIGAMRQVQGQIEESLIHYEQALATYRKLGNDTLLAGTLTNISQATMSLSPERAAELLFEAIDIMERIGDEEALQKTYNTLGNLEQMRMAYHSALVNHRKALTLAYKNESPEYAIALHGIGGDYLELGQQDSALFYLQKALLVKDSLLVNEEIDKDKPITLYTLAKTHLANQAYDKAEPLFKEVIRYYENSNNKKQLAHALLGELEVLMAFPERRGTESIETILQRVEQITSVIDSPGLLFDYQSALYKTYRLRGDYQAAAALLPDMLKTRDRMLDEKAQNKMITLSVGHEVKLMKQTITTQKSTISRKQQITTLAIITAVVFLVLMILFFYNYRRAELSRKAEKQAREEVNKQKERIKQLHQEMYHRVKNNLATFSSILQLEINRHNNATETAEVLREQRNRLTAIKSIHKKLYLAGDEETTVALDLKTYLTDLSLDIMENFDYLEKVKMCHDIDPLALDMDRALLLGQLLNEALTNACKYAVPGHPSPAIHITLKQTESLAWALTVADNGPQIEGITREAGTDSLGMRIFKNLSRQLGAEWFVETDAGVKHTWTFKP